MDSQNNTQRFNLGAQQQLNNGDNNRQPVDRIAQIGAAINQSQHSFNEPAAG